MAKRNMKFGVEIEFFGVTREIVKAALSAAGISVFVEGYNHETRGYWKLVTDASVNSTGCGGGSGNELVSPPLVGEAGLRELGLALTVLAEVGAKVDKTCGIHVHHEIADLAVEKVTNIFKLYYKFQKTIDYLMAPSRRAAYQSNPSNRCFTAPITKEHVERISELDSIGAIGNFMRGRYFTVNIQSYFKYKTIEFRQHGGSVDMEKVVNWVKITHKLIEKACVGWKVEIAKNEADWRVCDSNWWFRMMVGKDLESYVVNRVGYWREKEKATGAAA